MADRAQLYKYKGNRCSSCGLSVQEMVERFGTLNRMFEFHHIDPGTKHAQYSNLMKRRLSPEQIEEADKCTLLCGQCHSIIHAQNITAKLWLSVTIDGREVAQNFDGWVVCDLVDKTMKFVTNQCLLLQPCEVRFGAGGSVKLCVIEIEKQQHLLNWLHNLDALKSVEIVSLVSGETRMTLEHMGKKRVKITQALGFPVTALNFSTDAKKDNIWLRNGIFLTDSGDVFTSGSFSYECELRDIDV